MPSPPPALSMSREHEQDRPAASLTPSAVAAGSIAAGDEQFVANISGDAVHALPEQQYQLYPLSPQQVKQKQHQHYHQQPHSVPTYPTGHYPSSAASSPGERLSMSGSSTGSYSIPPRANWDSAMSSSSYPAEPARTPPDLDTHAHGPRAEAGHIKESYKEGHSRLSWTGEVSSDGRNSRSAHDVPNTVTVYAAEDKERDLDREPNAVLVLLLFSTPIPFFSICTCLYTLVALLLVIFTTPLRLCPPTTFFRSTTFSTQLCKLLAPVLRNHERLAQSSTSDYHHNPYNNTHSTAITTDHFSAGWLITVLALAPFLCIGLSLAVWIAAFFWIFAMILGNPDGTEKGDDGRAAVLGVNTWWQTWLSKGRISR